jgi:UDP-glucuronate decarboxylase
MEDLITKHYLNNKTVLITGAAGFIASHLVDKCLELGAIVIGVDNFITGRQINLKHLDNDSNFYLVEADVSQTSEEYLELALDQLQASRPEANKIDVLFHLASPASPPAYQKQPIETYLVNSIGTHNLLSFLQKHYPEARFIYASTSEVYGDPQVHPQPEDYWGHVNPNGLRSCYDESKRLGETICGVFERNYQIDVRIARIFNTYGPRMRPDDGRILPNFINQALRQEPLTVYGDGKQSRAYCFVSDLVAGLVELASRDNLAGETINLGNPDEYTVLQTALLVQKIINREITKGDIVFKDLPSDDPTRRQPDISKAQKLLNWQPKIEFRDGLAKTIEYFQSQEAQVLE